jgi:hypothetical protein
MTRVTMNCEAFQHARSMAHLLKTQDDNIGADKGSLFQRANDKQERTLLHLRKQ